MTGKVVDLTGQRFGKLTARIAIIVDKKRSWVCDCECGGVITRPTFQLIAGNIVQCKQCTGDDLVGFKSGKLIVEKRIPRDDAGRRGWKWGCRCECGGYIEVHSRYLQRQSTTHCGCMKSINMGKGRTLPNNSALWKKLFGSYKANAKTRNLCFEILETDFVTICQLSCHYCGTKPSRPLDYEGKAETRTILYNGIDRKDNSIGYTSINIVPCCYRCNIMKRDIDYDDFLEHIHKIVKHISILENLC